MQTLHFTKSLIAKLPYSEKRVQYRDLELPQLILRVGSRTKTFYAVQKVNYRFRRIKIGNATVMNPVVAREKCREILGMITKDPAAPSPSKKLSQVKTLRETWEDYQIDRPLEEKTKRDYHNMLHHAFKDWLDEPITAITGDMVRQRHRELGRNSGQAYANYSMQTLRALINYAKAEYRDEKGNPIILVNPVSRLSETRTWYKKKRRRTFIPFHMLGAWLDAVDRLENRTVRAYLLTLLFTGLRKTEAAQMRWSWVDFEAKKLTIPEEVTKNDDPHVLPLPDFIAELLQEHKKVSTGPYVFSLSGGPIVELRRHMQKVTEMCSVTFTLHDLRRTFITIAESLDISYYALKRLINHRLSSDVTAGYIVPNPERLREPMNRIAKKILSAREPRESRGGHSPLSEGSSDRTAGPSRREPTPSSPLP